MSNAEYFFCLFFSCINKPQYLFLISQIKSKERTVVSLYCVVDAMQSAVGIREISFSQQWVKITVRWFYARERSQGRFNVMSVLMEVCIHSSLWTYCILVLWLLEKNIIIFELGFPEGLAENQRKGFQATGHPARRRAWRSGRVQCLQAAPSQRGGWKKRGRGWGARSQPRDTVCQPSCPTPGRDSPILSYYCDPPSLFVCAEPGVQNRSEVLLRCTGRKW